MPDRLRALWDFSDLDASERRFRAALGEELSAAGRAEILTQLARIEGLRGDFDAGERLVEEAESEAAGELLPRVRIDLERGRLYRSSGDRERALPLFGGAARQNGDAHLLNSGELMQQVVAGDDADDAAVAPHQGGRRLARERDPNAPGPISFSATSTASSTCSASSAPNATATACISFAG